MSYPAWMAFAALSIIWGFPYFLIKVAVTDVPPLMIAWSRVTPPAATIGCIAALGIVCTALAMMLMFYLVHQAGASRATLITSLNPAVASVLGVALLHERLGASGLLAFALILLGSWLATRPASPKLVELAAER